MNMGKDAFPAVSFKMFGPEPKIVRLTIGSPIRQPEFAPSLDFVVSS